MIMTPLNPPIILKIFSNFYMVVNSFKTNYNAINLLSYQIHSLKTLNYSPFQSTMQNFFLKPKQVFDAKFKMILTYF